VNLDRYQRRGYALPPPCVDDGKTHARVW
jgi:hypothetical protein